MTVGMELLRLDTVFKVRYGVSLALNSLIIRDHGIPFVSRTEKNNGVIARVAEVDGLVPNPSHTLSVAAGGSVLATFYQPESYYSGFHVFCLTPREDISVKEMLLYSKLINCNSYRYSYGRQANKTLKGLLIPSRHDVSNLSKRIEIVDAPSEKPFECNREICLVVEEGWEDFLLSDLFEIAGTRTPPVKYLEECGRGNYPYVTTRSSNNGVGGFYDFKTEEGHVLVIDSAVAGYCTYQEKEFSASDHVEKLIPRFRMNQYVAMFLTTIINLNRFRYNYGRKACQERLFHATIKLPSTDKGAPDWGYMERFIKSLPYSTNI